MQISNIILVISVALITISVFIVLFELLRNTDLYVKLVAFELLTGLLISIIAVWSMLRSQSLYLDICIALALIMFVSTIAYCQLLMNRSMTE